MAEPKTELTLTRTFDAPPQHVWRAWTDPDVVRKWWGPWGVTNPVFVWECRPGGKIDIVMRAGKELGEYAGQEWPMNGTFSEVTPTKRLVYTAAALEDMKSNKTMITTKTAVMLSDVNGKTKLTVRIDVIGISDSPKAKFAVQGMEAGWNQQLDKLDAELKGAKQ